MPIVYRVVVSDEITYIFDRRKDADDYVRRRGEGRSLTIETIRIGARELARLPEA